LRIIGTMKSFLRVSSGLTLAISIGGLALTLVGCDKKPAAASQVAAKVNSDEISVHQVNYALSKLPNVTPEKAEQARRQILSQLVEQQLAVQQATENKLDRSPEVVAAMEATKREILTRAYYSQVLAGLPQPTADEIKKYYREHPELFAQRRVYSLQEIVIPADKAPLKELRAMAGSKSLGDIAAWLKKKDVPFAGNSGIRAAEQVPLNVLALLHETADGKILVIETPPNVQVVRIAGSQSTPVDEATAEQPIRQYLSNLRARDAVAQHARLLQEKAKIEYLGEFAKNNEARPAAAESAAAPAEATPVAAPASDQREPAAKASAPSNKVEKGIAALK
jgi:EpsD family peptidyl-prolyl cis-trans isomerase